VILIEFERIWANLAEILVSKILIKGNQLCELFFKKGDEPHKIKNVQPCEQN